MRRQASNPVREETGAERELRCSSLFGCVAGVRNPRRETLRRKRHQEKVRKKIQERRGPSEAPTWSKTCKSTHQRLAPLRRRWYSRHQGRRRRRQQQSYLNQAHAGSSPHRPAMAAQTTVLLDRPRRRAEPMQARHSTNCPGWKNTVRWCSTTSRAMSTRSATSRHSPSVAMCPTCSFPCVRRHPALVLLSSRSVCSRVFPRATLFCVAPHL